MNLNTDGIFSDQEWQDAYEQNLDSIEESQMPLESNNIILFTNTT